MKCRQHQFSVHGKFMDKYVLVFVPRVYNYEPLTQLKNVRANCYGKYVALRGTVVRVSNIKPLCTKMAFLCAACGEVQSFSLPDGKYNLPTKVVSCSLTTLFTLVKKANHSTENTSDVYEYRVYFSFQFLNYEVLQGIGNKEINILLSTFQNLHFASSRYIFKDMKH